RSQPAAVPGSRPALCRSHARLSGAVAAAEAVGARRRVLAADQIATTVEANLVLRVDWVESPQIRTGRLGITICPGRRDRDRNLETDLARLRAEGVDRLLCLSTDAELDWAGVPDLGSRAEAFG